MKVNMNKNNLITNSYLHDEKTRSNLELHPDFITGLTDAEGCFSISLNKDKRAKFKRNVSLKFRINMLNYEAELLHMVKSFFNCGTLLHSKDGFVCFVISDISSIKHKVIPHFLKYPLRGTKYLDFIAFRKAFQVIESKSHLLEKGLDELFKISKSMNSYREFPISTYYSPPHTVKDNISFIPLSGYYVNGFIAGDGCLSLDLKGRNFGKMSLHITQHLNNKLLLESIANYFACPLRVYRGYGQCLLITLSGIKL